MKKLMLASALVLAACGGKAPEAEAPAAPEVAAEVTLALNIAAGIDAAPAATDSVLRAHNLSAAGFDSLLYKIAEDSTLSAQYAAGRR